MPHGTSKIQNGVLVAVPSFIATPQTAVVLIDTAAVTATAGVQIAPPSPQLVQRWAMELEMLDPVTQAQKLCNMLMKKPFLAAMVRVELRSRKQKKLARERRQRYHAVKKTIDEKYRRTSVGSTSSASSTAAPSCSAVQSPTASVGSGASSSGHNVGSDAPGARDVVDLVGARDLAVPAVEVDMSGLADVVPEVTEDENIMLQEMFDDNDALPDDSSDEEQPSVFSTF
jgi:hypothetical protein